MPRPLEALAFGWIPVRSLYGILATASLGVGLYGLWLVAHRSAIGLSLVFYFIILAIWPHPADRFLWAVLPWLALVWAVAVSELWRRWPRVRIPAGALAAFAVGGYLHYRSQGFSRRGGAAQTRATSAKFAERPPVVQN